MSFKINILQSNDFQIPTNYWNGPTFVKNYFGSWVKTGEDPYTSTFTFNKENIHTITLNTVHLKHIYTHPVWTKSNLFPYITIPFYLL